MSRGTETSFAQLEAHMRDVVAMSREITPDHVSVSIVHEARDGRNGVRVDVLVDGAPCEEAERLVAAMLKIATRAATVLLGASGTTHEPQ